MVDESALLNRIEAVETASVSLRADQDFLNNVELDEEDEDNADREDERRKGSKAGNGAVDESVDVRIFRAVFRVYSAVHVALSLCQTIFVHAAEIRLSAVKGVNSDRDETKSGSSSLRTMAA